MSRFFKASGVTSQYIENSARSQSSIRPFNRHTEADIIISLDDGSFENGLPGWKAMKVGVEIEHLGRGISGAFNQKHWAWLIKSESFFCTIEYGQSGIVIQYFDNDKDIVTACAAIMGDSNLVFYNDKYRTSMTFNEILKCVDDLKSSWKSCHYDVILHNCRNFVREIGAKMDPNFNPPSDIDDFTVSSSTYGAYNLTFPKSRCVC